MDYNKLIENLNKNGFVAKIFDDENQMYQEMKNNIDKTEQIGFGGSMSLAEIDITGKLSEDGFNVCTTKYTGLDYVEVARKNLNADVYVSSVNGISIDGTIVNIDGTGNRIGATCFGAEKVFYILGTNKVEETTEKAIWRARNIASPLNSKRLERKTPCVITGKCENCDSPERICRGVLLVERPFTRKTTYVYVIKKSLGF